jgi:Short C-terminal domain
MMRRRGMGVVGTAVVVGGAAHYGAKKANQAAASQEQAQQAAYEQGLAAAQQQAAPAPAPVEDDPMAEVQKLAEMHAAGILTDDEFAAAKAKALGI